ncbi:MAG TPA: hypothetical protein VGW35_16220 [Methylomirabilota bacterium]|nr:hypothetical protein [Methylomirabilota bacterium]
MTTDQYAVSASLVMTGCGPHAWVDARCLSFLAAAGTRAGSAIVDATTGRIDVFDAKGRPMAVWWIDLSAVPAGAPDG